MGKKCVKFFLCKEDGTIITDGSFLIDERFSGDSVTLTCPANEVCCTLENFINTTEAKLEPKDFFSSSPNCGLRDSKEVSPSMVNSTQNVLPGEFPWLVDVVEKFDFFIKATNIYRGSGSLIHPKVVLTAVHTLYGVESQKLLVRAGASKSSNESSNRVMNVQKFVIHEEFSREKFRNDVALLILQAEFELSSAISTVCLPPPNAGLFGLECVATGWGKRKFGELNKQNSLRKINLHSIDRKSCRLKTKTERIGQRFAFHQGLLCAGE